MLFSILVLLPAAALAALNGPCSVSGTPGVCVKTASCAKAGGTSRTGFCPNDPPDVKCCIKTQCGNGGNCRWTHQCQGNTVSNLCPGPAGFKCCEPKAGSDPATPTIPPSGCKSHVIDGGYRIMKQFPGVVRQVYCYVNKAQDHGLGLALDLMIKNRSPVGREMAEWTMNNHKELKVKYVMWGQKIWAVEVDKTPKPWEKWRDQNPKDRGDDTKNHWDHNHVSFLPA